MFGCVSRNTYCMSAFNFIIGASGTLSLSCRTQKHPLSTSQQRERELPGTYLNQKTSYTNMSFITESCKNKSNSKGTEQGDYQQEE